MGNDLLENLGSTKPRERLSERRTGIEQMHCIRDARDAERNFQLEYRAGRMLVQPSFNRIKFRYFNHPICRIHRAVCNRRKPETAIGMPSRFTMHIEWRGMG